MNLQPNMVQSNVGASRPILFLSAWLLGNQPPSMGILLCDPGKNADACPASRLLTASILETRTATNHPELQRVIHTQFELIASGREKRN
jgi:hypothetical protein